MLLPRHCSFILGIGKLNDALECVFVAEVEGILNDAGEAVATDGTAVVVAAVDPTTEGTAVVVADPTAALTATDTPPPNTNAPATIAAITGGDRTNGAAALFKTHTPADISYPSTHGADPAASRRAQSRFNGHPWVRL